LIPASDSGTLQAQDGSLSFALNSLRFSHSGQAWPNTNNNDDGGGSSPRNFIRNVKQCIACRERVPMTTNGRRMTIGARDAGCVSQRLFDDCTTMFFYRNKHIMVDLGTGNNNKINWAMADEQELIDIIEMVYPGARKGRSLVVSPKDYSTKYRH
jgi:hypothetical protein